MKSSCWLNEKRARREERSEKDQDQYHTSRSKSCLSRSRSVKSLVSRSRLGASIWIIIKPIQRRIDQGIRDRRKVIERRSGNWRENLLGNWITYRNWAHDRAHTRDKNPYRDQHPSSNPNRRRRTGAAARAKRRKNQKRSQDQDLVPFQNLAHENRIRNGIP